MGQNKRPNMSPVVKYVDYGRIADIPMVYFASQNTFDACEMLIEQKNGEATAALFEREAAKPSKSLLAFVGVAQTRTVKWNEMILDLEKQLKEKPQDQVTQAHLAILLWYRARETYFERIRTKMVPVGANAFRAQKILGRIWTQTHNPIAGLVAGEMADLTHQGPNAYSVAEQLILDYSGGQANKLYLQAKQNKWKASPPPVALIPAETFNALMGVVEKIWSLSGATGSSSVEVNGKWVTTPTIISPERKRQQAYFDKWRQNLHQGHD